ncbi:MAG: hypothetical protein KTR32_01430 [Granulosicoccus sp.]|nr:hypothetical protein [Granulosicoccus sp.]
MRELLELQTGQVAFISGLMSGFSLAIAAHILRYGIRSWIAQVVFLMFLVSSLMFLLALYVDVSLSIVLAGVDQIADSAVYEKIESVRNLGTSSATAALVIFIVAIGLLGWLAKKSTGVLSSLMAVLVLCAFWYVWHTINLIGLLVAS